MAETVQNHYLALYRKYRPRTFDEVRGRENIVRTLQNQISTGRIGHSYLFCGTRGTGKTTIAKIFARAVNCENPQDGNPCGVCPVCQATLRDANMNVVEMDAASNNGVEDVRNIIDEVSYSPTLGRYRVYIIDEVHMLSPAAFNALLKTLEEPPGHAIFILATTEPNKLPITILSRCQRYDFGRIPTPVIMQQLQDIARKEGLKVEEKAMLYIASAADGSMRDGLSILDQCSAFNYGGEELTYEKTLEILGAVDARTFSDLFRSLHENRVKDALDILDRILEQGRELIQFVGDFIWYLRNIMLLKASEETGKSMDVSQDNLTRMIEDARCSELHEVIRYINVFSALSEQIRYSGSRRILTETALIRLCEPAMDLPENAQETVRALEERIRVLEQKLIQDEKILADAARGLVSGSAAAMQPSVNPAGIQQQPSGQSGDTPAERRRPALPKALPADLKTIVENWSLYLAELPAGYIKGLLQSAKLSVDESGQLLVLFDNYISADAFKNDNEMCATRVRALLNSKLGKEVPVRFIGLDTKAEFTDNYVDLGSIHWDQIEIVDDPGAD